MTSIITARLTQPITGKPYWRVDGCLCGPDVDANRANAERWNAACKDDAGRVPQTIILELDDDAEAFGLYRSGRIELRECEILAEGIAA